MSEHWTAENIYDERIAPLMTQIIAVCKEHGIPLACTFQYENDAENGPGFCTTLIPNNRQCDEMKDLNRAHSQLVRGNAVCLAETHETLPNGSKRITIRGVS